MKPSTRLQKKHNDLNHENKSGAVIKMRTGERKRDLNDVNKRGAGIKENTIDEAR